VDKEQGIGWLMMAEAPRALFEKVKTDSWISGIDEMVFF
jgi:hypothetical protein